MSAGYVAWAVANNFDKLPGDVRNKLLLRLSEKKDVTTGHVAGVIAENVTWAVANNFDKLPSDVRNKLLVNLPEKDKAAQYVARIIARNYDKFPIAVKNLLDKLQKPLQQVIEDLSRNEEQKDQEEALCLISNVLSKLNLNFVLKTLNDLSKSRNENVRTEAAKLLKTVSGDLDGDE